MQRIRFTVRDLAAASGLSRRQVWRHVKLRKLPKPSHASGTKATWRREDVRPWLAWRKGKPLCRELAKALTTLDPSRFAQPGLSTLMTVEQVADLLKVGERTVWRWVADGEMPAPEPGKLRPRLWRRDVILAWQREKRKAMGLPADEPGAADALHAMFQVEG